MKKREVRFEGLRILAMFMIVILHYLGKGGALTPAKTSFTTNSYLAWLLEAFCMVSVNIYVLISGYFGVRASFRVDKILKIWLQVVFYSVAIGAIMIVCGNQAVDLYVLLGYICPIVTEHYWFATSYLMLLCLMPFLNAGMQGLEKKSLQVILAVLGIYTCIAKSVIPMQLPWDHDGYDFLWFVFLYLIGAYIRQYGLRYLNQTWKGIALYVVCALTMYGGMLVIRELYLRYGILESMVTYTYSYNHLLCLLGSLGMFVGFVYAKTSQKPISEKMQRMICKVSGATFGVYLIHEQMNMRGMWDVLFKTKNAFEGGMISFVLHLLVTVFAVFFACTIIECVRQWGVQRLFQNGEK